MRRGRGLSTDEYQRLVFTVVGGVPARTIRTIDRGGPLALEKGRERLRLGVAALARCGRDFDVP